MPDEGGLGAESGVAGPLPLILLGWGLEGGRGPDEETGFVVGCFLMESGCGVDGGRGALPDDDEGVAVDPGLGVDGGLGVEGGLGVDGGLGKDWLLDAEWSFDEAGLDEGCPFWLFNEAGRGVVGGLGRGRGVDAGWYREWKQIKYDEKRAGDTRDLGSEGGGAGDRASTANQRTQLKSIMYCTRHMHVQGIPLSRILAAHLVLTPPRAAVSVWKAAEAWE